MAKSDPNIHSIPNRALYQTVGLILIKWPWIPLLTLSIDLQMGPRTLRMRVDVTYARLKQAAT